MPLTEATLSPQEAARLAGSLADPQGMGEETGVSQEDAANLLAKWRASLPAVDADGGADNCAPAANC